VELKPSESGPMSHHYCICRSASQEIHSTYLFYSAILIIYVHWFIPQIDSKM